MGRRIAYHLTDQSLSKYRNKKTVVDNIKFDSKREAMRYLELRYLEQIKQIRDLQLQVPFELIPAQRGDDGKVKERAIVYKADFVYYDRDGNLVVEDAKSSATRTEL